MNCQSVLRSLFILFALVLSVVAAPGWSNRAVYGHEELPEASCYTAMLDSWIGKPQSTWSTWTTYCTVFNTAATTTLIIPATSTITALSTVTVTSADAGQTEKYTTTLTSTTTVIATETRIERSYSATTTTTTLAVAPTALIEDFTEELFVQLLIKDNRKPESDTPMGFNDDSRNGIVSRLSEHTLTLPGDVICYHAHSECTTSTVIHTDNITITSSTTVTRVATETHATYPNATTTTTVATTSLATSTKTVTSTTFSYNFIATATATFWEACAQSNIASSVDTIPIIDGELSSNTRRLSSHAGQASPYDCCAAAQLNPLSAVWAWDPAQATCHIFETDTCGRGHKRGRANTPIVSHTKGQPRYLIGNGSCGKWTDMKYV